MLSFLYQSPFDFPLECNNHKIHAFGHSRTPTPHLLYLELEMHDFVLKNQSYAKANFIGVKLFFGTISSLRGEVVVWTLNFKYIHTVVSTQPVKLMTFVLSSFSFCTLACNYFRFRYFNFQGYFWDVRAVHEAAPIIFSGMRLHPCRRSARRGDGSSTGMVSNMEVQAKELWRGYSQI